MAWDTGCGKSHGAMATAAMLFADEQIDICVLIAERNKVREWFEDFETFTKLSVARYEGTPTKRRKLLTPERRPQVLIATYETARQDMVGRDAVDPRKLSPGVFTEALSGLRVLVVYDEMAKLGNRASLLHRAHHFAIKAWRLTGQCRVLGLTATPMERNPENYYNLGRILTPDTVGTVKSFHAQHVTDYDLFGNASKFRDLPGLAAKMAPVLLRKRKTDPDVRDQFPTMVERFTWVDLSKDHQRFYDSVEHHIQAQGDPMLEQVGFTVLRMIAGHPLALADSQGELALQIVADTGMDTLERLGSAKADHLIDYLTKVCIGQGAQAVVFSYYVSILRLLAQQVADAGIGVACYHGQMDPAERERAKAAFKAGAVPVLLASSAAEKGINLPEASYVINFDLPTKHSAYTQRLNRISRIGSAATETVVAQSFIVANTIEEAIAKLWLGRNYQQDVLLDGDAEDADDDDAFLSVADRRALLRAAQRSHKEQR